MKDLEANFRPWKRLEYSPGYNGRSCQRRKVLPNCRECQEELPPHRSYGSCNKCKVLRRRYRRDNGVKESDLKTYCRICNNKLPLHSKYRRCKECRRSARHKFHSGLVAYAFLKQKGRCKICREKLTQYHVDHDHETGEFRGLLCGNCNVGLGCFKDNIESLKRAIVYLLESKENLIPLEYVTELKVSKRSEEVRRILDL